MACEFAASPGPSSQPPAAKPRKARKTTPRRELKWASYIHKSSDKATLTARDVEGAVRLLLPSAEILQPYEWRSPVKVRMCGAAAALTCRQHEEILFSHTLDICVCQEGLVAGPFALVFWRLRLDWLWRRWWQAPQLSRSPSR
ncbi:hypothetical protein WJX72_004292 [[Myrmecia] bisecta]|uniref:Uncharacterized protein n=1 Tax=[Myrmecia] bisecta TaxID=41462 RepID=A0AAW1P771_9CHLO